jgi:AcrR family transcriptional regulator
MDDVDHLPLRERKQRRTREGIVEAAMTLFAEHGFDGVTVTDIAQQAEVGRSTFFRYFTDKQEVLFADDGELRDVLVTASEETAEALAPLGSSLADALVVARAGLLALTRRIGQNLDAMAVRARLIEAHPELQARNLVKERAYRTAGIEVMRRYGATPEIATLAANLAAACFASGYSQSLATGGDLPTAVDEAFQRLATLNGPPLQTRLQPAHPPGRRDSKPRRGGSAGR